MKLILRDDRGFLTRMYTSHDVMCMLPHLSNPFLISLQKDLEVSWVTETLTMNQIAQPFPSDTLKDFVGCSVLTIEALKVNFYLY